MLLILLIASFCFSFETTVIVQTPTQFWENVFYDGLVKYYEIYDESGKASLDEKWESLRTIMVHLGMFPHIESIKSVFGLITDNLTDGTMEGEDLMWKSFEDQFNKNLPDCVMDNMGGNFCCALPQGCD